MPLRYCSHTRHVKKSEEVEPIKSDEETIKEFQLAHFDTNHDQILSDDEIANVDTIDLYLFDSKDRALAMEAIKIFSNLQTLNCNYCDLTTIDVSMFKKLKELYCRGNQLTTIDVSKCSKSIWVQTDLPEEKIKRE